MRARILHTMIRVGDLQKSIMFYTEALGMTLLRTFDNPENRYTLAFLGYGKEESDTVIELTYNYGTAHYEKGDAYGHIAIGVENCSAFCEQLRNYPARIKREPGPLKGGAEIIAFAEDPDGNSIEIIERPEQWLLKF